MVTTENWKSYTQAEHDLWAKMYARQKEILPNYAAPEITNGLEELEIRPDRIPKFSRINQILKKASQFSIVPVKGFIPEKLFFQFLSMRQFPSTCFIRKPDQIEYLVEPDVFHDVFGHVALLANPIFADFMQEFGKRGLESIEYGYYKQAAALYWFTVEFGLIQTSKGLRVYGAGIASSIGETKYAIDSPQPHRFKFDMLRAMKTQYKIDHFQKGYFVIDSYQQLFDTLHEMNWTKLKPLLDQTPNIPEGHLQDPSELHPKHRGA